MSPWKRFLGSLYIYGIGVFFILLIHLSLAAFMVYELSVFYASLGVGLFFYFLSVVFLLPIFYYFMKSRYSMRTSLGVLLLVFLSFLGIHLTSVLGVGSPVGSVEEFQKRKNKLYVSRYFIHRAQRDVSENRQKLLKSQLSELEHQALSKLSEL